MKLFLKGERCFTDKCAFERRPYRAGQHDQGRIKPSDYSIRLREKQKVRSIYGVLERQFRRYFEMADQQKGVTGENLLMFLERRLDNVVYRMGFAKTRPDARQLVRHNHVLVNGKRVNIPSYLARAGDEVTLRERSRNLQRVDAALEFARTLETVPWVEVDSDKKHGKVKTLPTRESITVPIREQLIVEFYSR
jgi:small subunit ribosomal protein S4